MCTNRAGVQRSASLKEARFHLVALNLAVPTNRLLVVVLLAHPLRPPPGAGQLRHAHGPAHQR